MIFPQFCVRWEHGTQSIDKSQGEGADRELPVHFTGAPQFDSGLSWVNLVDLR